MRPSHLYHLRKRTHTRCSIRPGGVGGVWQTGPSPFSLRTALLPPCTSTKNQTAGQRERSGVHPTKTHNSVVTLCEKSARGKRSKYCACVWRESNLDPGHRQLYQKNHHRRRQLMTKAGFSLSSDVCGSVFFMTVTSTEPSIRKCHAVLLSPPPLPSPLHYPAAHSIGPCMPMGRQVRFTCKARRYVRAVGAMASIAVFLISLGPRS